MIRLIVFLIFSLSLGFAQTITAEFNRVPVELKMPTGQSVAIECQDEGADYPYTPYDWPDAKASLEIKQAGASSTVTIRMSGVKPNMYYTMWLRLRSTDNEGNEVGGNPLIGIPGTPLIPATELAKALTFTGPGNAGIGLSNGFWSDEKGDAFFLSTVDFPIIGGAYPFHNFEGFDPGDERLKSPFKEDAPMAIPAAIATSGAPFTLRIASHCESNVNYGLFPGPHEGWFDWIAQP